MPMARSRYVSLDATPYNHCIGRCVRRANAEDQCTGRFWEGRFKSQAILDEAGLVACCAYVDLNPIRAGIADLPATSDYTSIQQRLRELNHGAIKSIQREERNRQPRTSAHEEKVAFVPLHPFGSSLDVAHAQGLPCTAHDYIELVDWAARIVRSDKNHAMSSRVPSILSRLGSSPEEFEKAVRAKAMTRGTVIAQADRLKAYAEHLNERCVYGVALPCSV